jgi:hypothetical protein
MIIHIGRQTILLTPIGTFLYGTKGRVDVEGSAAKSRFILVDKDAVRNISWRPISGFDPNRPQRNVEEPKKIDWTWKIASAPPVVRFIDLNKESLFQMLLEVSNG